MQHLKAAQSIFVQIYALRSLNCYFYIDILYQKWYNILEWIFDICGISAVWIYIEDRNGERIVKPKHIIISLIYLASMFLLASPKYIGIFTHGTLLVLLGIVLMLALTAFYGMFIYSATLKPPVTTATLPAKETEREKYQKLLNWFMLYRDLDRNYSMDRLLPDLAAAHRDEILRNNPFRNTDLGKRMQDTASDIGTKYEQTINILSEAFNQGDITYQNYLSVLDNVLKVSNAHLRSIKKRLSVFDYNTWGENQNDSMCMKYIEEVNSSVVQLEGIERKFDTLIHELVCLDEISEAPLVEMQTLIETTSDYKTLEE